MSICSSSGGSLTPARGDFDGRPGGGRFDAPLGGALDFTFVGVGGKVGFVVTVDDTDCARGAGGTDFDRAGGAGGTDFDRAGELAAGRTIGPFENGWVRATICGRAGDACVAIVGEAGFCGTESRIDFDTGSVRFVACGCAITGTGAFGRSTAS